MPSPRDILRAHIAITGLSQPDYCVYRLAGRSTRCLTYWLSGTRPVPSSVVRWLEAQPEYSMALHIAELASLSTD